MSSEGHPDHTEQPSEHHPSKDKDKGIVLKGHHGLLIVGGLVVLYVGYRYVTGSSSASTTAASTVPLASAGGTASGTASGYSPDILPALVGSSSGGSTATSTPPSTTTSTTSSGTAPTQEQVTSAGNPLQSTLEDFGTVGSSGTLQSLSYGNYSGPLYTDIGGTLSHINNPSVKLAPGTEVYGNSTGSIETLTPAQGAAPGPGQTTYL